MSLVRGGFAKATQACFIGRSGPQPECVKRTAARTPRQLYNDRNHIVYHDAAIGPYGRAFADADSPISLISDRGL